MKTRHLLLSALLMVFIGLMASCSSVDETEPSSLLNGVYEDLNDGNYNDMLQYIQPPLGKPLSEKESDTFTTEMKNLYGELEGKIKVSGIEKDSTYYHDENSDKYIVHCDIEGAKSLDDNNYLAKGKDGKWRVLVIDTLVTYSSSRNDTKRSLSLLRNLEYVFTKILAERGNAESQYALASYYENGAYCKKDLKKAFNIFLNFSKKGNSDADYRLSQYYFKGIVVKKDSVKGFSYLKKSYDGSSVFGCYELGLCYEKGNLVEKDPKKAYECYLRGYNFGSVECATKLAYILYYGIGVPKDIVKAKECMDRSISLLGYSPDLDLQSKIDEEYNLEQAKKERLQAIQDAKDKLQSIREAVAPGSDWTSRREYSNISLCFLAGNYIQVIQVDGYTTKSMLMKYSVSSGYDCDFTLSIGGIIEYKNMSRDEAEEFSHRDLDITINGGQMDVSGGGIYQGTYTK